MSRPQRSRWSRTVPELYKVLDESLFDIREYSDIAQVVSAARSMTRDLGFAQNQQFLIASAVSELATNIVRYAGQGQMTLKMVQCISGPGFQAIAQDKGPGINDMQKAMQDHFSSGNGLGLGLPSVKRIMDDFEIETQLGSGTRVQVCKWVN